MKRFLLATVFVCLAAGSLDLRADPAALAESNSPDAFSGAGGLTRNSLEEAAQAPRPRPKLATVPRAPVRHRTHRARPSTAHASSPTWRPAEGRRNLFVSFIYTWNGWVIHTFHTTKGTVMLHRIGFKG